MIAGYLTDASNIRGRAAGLVRPRSTAEVAAVVEHCQQHGVPLTVSAGRTSTTASAVPDGGWVLSTEHLDQVLYIGDGTATAQAGVILGAFQDAVEQTGQSYPPDPTSRYGCTLGASVATNASGARSFAFGPTRRWVEAVTVVLPDGTVRTVAATDPIPESWPRVDAITPRVKSAAGYSGSERLLDLFIGQEGTLGVLTEITVRLIPSRPFFTLLAFFDGRRDAVAFVRRARDPHGPLRPRALEYLDQHCLALARARGVEVPEAAGAALLCEQEHDGDDGALEAWLAALDAAGALVDDTVLAEDPASQERLRRFRHAIPAGINERVVRNGMPKVGTDLSVPDAGLDAMMDAYEAAPLDHVLFGHIGDNHLHLNLLPTTPEELAVARAFYDDLARKAVDLGGSVSAEHGIGKLKRQHLAWMVGPAALQRFAALKEFLDPAWILGRGNILAVPPHHMGAEPHRSNSAL